MKMSKRFKKKLGLEIAIAFLAISIGFLVTHSVFSWMGWVDRFTAKDPLSMYLGCAVGFVGIRVFLFVRDWRQKGKGQ